MGSTVGNYKQEYLDLYAQKQAMAAQRRKRKDKKQEPENISGSSELTELWDGEDRKVDPASRVVVAQVGAEHRVIEILVVMIILSMGMWAEWLCRGEIAPVFPLLVTGSLLLAVKY